jgi:hypothetical protein
MQQYNNGVMKTISKQRLGKHVPAEIISELLIGKGSVNTPTTKGLLLEMVFSIHSMQSGYKEEFS